MALPDGLFGLLALVVLLFVVVVLAVVRAWGTETGGPASDRAWRHDVASLARQLESDLSALVAPVDPDRLQRTVLPLAGRFDRLAREAPAGTDATLARRVYDLGVACKRLGIERAGRGTPIGDPTHDDEVTALAERAGRVAEAASPDAVGRREAGNDGHGRDRDGGDGDGEAGRGLTARF